MHENPYQAASRTDLEALVVSRLPEIQERVRTCSLKYHLPEEDVQDIAGAVAVKVVANDYGSLRHFRGASSLDTYLTTLIRNQCRDHVGRLWGRWRPSAKARRLGPLAVELETLMRRDGFTSREAIETLATRSASAGDRARLEAIVRALPIPRTGPQTEVSSKAADPLEHEEARALVRACRRALEGALFDLPERDRELLRLRFVEGSSVPAIATRLGAPKRSLYTRLDRLSRNLRRRLEAQGFDGEAVLGALELVRHEDNEPSFLAAPHACAPMMSKPRGAVAP